MKIVIVGAGVSGLSAGIFALKAGYEVEIYEKNNVAGGCCSSWKRGDFTIDNCIHWLTGTKKGTPQYNVWKELGVIKDDEAFIQRESFYTSEYMGQKITLWRDLERTRKELLELSPEDEKEITRFIECVKLGEGLQIMKLCGFRWHIPFLLRETETFQKAAQKKLQTDLLQPLNPLAAGFTCPHLLRRFQSPIKKLKF